MTAFSYVIYYNKQPLTYQIDETPNVGSLVSRGALIDTESQHPGSAPPPTP